MGRQVVVGARRHRLNQVLIFALVEIGLNGTSPLVAAKNSHALDGDLSPQLRLHRALGCVHGEVSRPHVRIKSLLTLGQPHHLAHNAPTGAKQATLVKGVGRFKQLVDSVVNVFVLVFHCSPRFFYMTQLLICPSL